MKLKSIFLVLTAAAMMFSCGSNSSENTYSVDALCNFEYQDAAEMTGEAGVYFKDYFSGAGLLVFYNKANAAGTEFYGGCALVGLADDVLEEGHVSESELCVFGSGYDNSKYYATVKYSDIMPSYMAEFVQKDYGVLRASKFYVNNTNRLVNIAYFGLPEHDGEAAIPPFGDGDYLKVVLSALPNWTSSFFNTVEFTLAKCTNGILDVCKEWTEVDLSKLGDIGFMYVSVESNRDDIPLNFCFDNLAFNATISM